jgi:hypothetical protein
MACIREHVTEARDPGATRQDLRRGLDRGGAAASSAYPRQIMATDPMDRKSHGQQETYDNLPDTEARRDELNAARHTKGTAGMAAQRKDGEMPFGHHARAWLDSSD